MNNQPTLYIESTPFEELELNYRMAVGLVAAVRDNIRVMVPEHWFAKVAEYGWIKPTDDGYTVTENGHRVLSPRENHTEGLPVPYFPVRRRPYATTPDGQQACVFMKVLEQREAQQA